MRSGRPSNRVKTEIITVSTTSQIKHCLEKLALTGTYGKTATEVANHIIGEEIRELAREGTFLNPSDLVHRGSITHESS
jgi:hypothetical protein